MMIAPENSLENVTTKQLASELRRRIPQAGFDEEDIAGYLTQEDGPIEDADALAEATHRWQRREYGEALHYLEIALGRDFMGLGDLKLERQ